MRRVISALQRASGLERLAETGLARLLSTSRIQKSGEILGGSNPSRREKKIARDNKQHRSKKVGRRTQHLLGPLPGVIRVIISLISRYIYS